MKRLIVFVLSLGCCVSLLAAEGSGAPVVAPSATNVQVAAEVPFDLSADATGTQPLLYQWFREGVVQADQTNSTVQSTEFLGVSASYFCVVSNALGVATGSTVRVEAVALVLNRNPMDRSAFLGETTTFSFELSAKPPVSFQWFKAGGVIADATNETYQVASCDFSDSGSYHVMISNALGSVTSTSAVLNVTPVAIWGENDDDQASVPLALTNPVSIAAGGYHCLALQPDRTVVAWGFNSDGQSSVPAGLSSVVAVDAGEYFSLALLTDGTVQGWGDDENGAVSGATGLSNVVAVAAGAYHSLALSGSGTVAAWGYNDDGQTDIPAGLSNVVAVAAGAYHSLALRSDGTVLGWGDDWSDQVSVPAGLSHVVAIAAGDYHSLALQADGTLVGWGDEDDGQKPFPAGLGSSSKIATGGFFSMALSESGTVLAWGDNEQGQTNVPSSLQNITDLNGGYSFSMALIGTGKPFVEPSVESLHLLAGESFFIPLHVTGKAPLSFQWFKDDSALSGNISATLQTTAPGSSAAYYCVISNAMGTTTSATTTVCGAPLTLTHQPQGGTISAGEEWVFSVTATSAVPLSYQWQKAGVPVLDATQQTFTVSAAVLTDAGAYRVVVSNQYGSETSQSASLQVLPVTAWGRNHDGPTTVPDELDSILALASGAYFNLAVRSNHTVVAWGENDDGQTTVPPGLTNVVAVAGGYDHSVALCSDGSVVGWGNNDSEQTTIPSAASNVVAISAGRQFSMALRADGEVLAWGSSSYDRTQVPATLHDVTSISSGYNHSLALQADGTVVAWGENNSGQTQVPPTLGSVVAISAGQYHSVALQADGQVVVWGRSSTTNVPSNLTNVVAVAAGGYHTLALQADGTLVAWGEDGYQQSSPPPGLKNITLISAGQYHSIAVTGTGTPFVAPRVQRVEILANLPVHLSAEATGEHPLSYQWYRNQTAVFGETNRFLQATETIVGSVHYGCEISNALGVVTSAVTQVDIQALRITQQPQGGSSFLGGSWTFSVDVEGAEPFTYQWIFEGQNVAGATNEQYILSGMTDQQAGAYQVRVANASGVETSQVATLEIGWIASWGSNDYGQCNLPAGISNTVALSAGYAHSLALAGDGTVIGWGDNTYGQATPPVGLNNAVAVEVGAYDSFALRSDGTLVSWGIGFAGENIIPEGLSNVVAVSSKIFHTLALQADGHVTAWGWNEYGQSSVPASLTNATAVSAGMSHSLALIDDGTVVGWGSTTNDLLAIPTGLTNVVAISAGMSHSLALLDSGTVVTWGWNTNGLLNIPVGLSNVVAISAGSTHSLALKDNGTVVAWGDLAQAVPAGLANVTAISAGVFHSLALLSDATIEDSDSDDLGDAWELRSFGDLTTSSGGSGNVDNDPQTDYQEYIADTLGGDSNDWFRVTSISNGIVYFDSSNARWYTLLGCTNLLSNDWKPVQSARMGVGGMDSMTSTNNLSVEFYKLTVELP